MSSRLRFRYFLLASATVAAGLMVHLHGDALPSSIRDVAGDALWAALIFWLASFAAPMAYRAWRVLAAAIVCLGVELSQLLRYEWLEALRHTRYGHLVLGSDFDARDLFAYSAGIAAAALLDHWLFSNQPRDESDHPIPGHDYNRQQREAE